MALDRHRCAWCGDTDIYVAYHDEEWGVPEYDSKALFAKLILDGAQAGLSWITILKKREGYYRLFDELDPEIIATYSDEYLEACLLDKGIIRNRLKVYSTRGNAQAYMRMKEEGIDFSKFLWSYVDHAPINSQLKEGEPYPATSEISDRLSKDLKKRGFKFVGSTIVYAFMQAVGMMNDHVTSCFRHQELSKK